MTTKQLDKDLKLWPLIATAHFGQANFNHSSSSIFSLSNDDGWDHAY